jgi:hypothetical protein
MSSAILTAYFPTLVPPYFCTSHLEDGSMVFWCIFGGVRGGGVPEDEEELEGGSDIFVPTIPESSASLFVVSGSAGSPVHLNGTVGRVYHRFLEPLQRVCCLS